MTSERRVWFYSYTWESESSGWRHYETMVTDRHPLYEHAEWKDAHQGNNDSELLSFHEITDDLAADDELRGYVHWSIDENGGELAGLVQWKSLLAVEEERDRLKAGVGGKRLAPVERRGKGQCMYGVLRVVRVVR